MRNPLLSVVLSKSGEEELVPKISAPRCESRDSSVSEDSQAVILRQSSRAICPRSQFRLAFVFVPQRLVRLS